MGRFGMVVRIFSKVVIEEELRGIIGVFEELKIGFFEVFI